LDQIQPEDSLVDRGVDGMLDEGYSPPERYSLIREVSTRRWMSSLQTRVRGRSVCATGRKSSTMEVGEERAGRLSS
jgi:hypothetical protein